MSGDSNFTQLLVTDLSKLFKLEVEKFLPTVLKAGSSGIIIKKKFVKELDEVNTF
jgi:hypothetical protein